MRDQEFWKKRIREGAVLDPTDRISEILFGLIMVLTFTGTISVATDGREEIGELLWAALGCNVAWGLVDAIMYLMDVAVERGHALKLLTELKEAKEAEARAILREEIQPAIASLMKDEELDQLAMRLKQLHPPSRSSLMTWADGWAAIQIFLLVFLCTLPVALPFAFLEEVKLAMRVSNGVALVLLFAGGFMLARYAGFRTLLTAVLYTLIGVLLVSLTMALGG